MDRALDRVVGDRVLVALDRDQGDVADRVDAREGGADLLRLGEVDGEVLALGVQLGGDPGAAFGVATGDRDPVPALQAELGQVTPQARRAP